MELATLLVYYQYISKTDVIAGKYYRCGENDFGSPLKIFNTNYRTLFGKRGSTYNGFAKGFICLETEEGKALLKQWGLEGEYIGVGHCILGYPAEEPKPAAPRKADYIVRV